MLVVGTDLRLRRYTSAAGKLLALTAADLGRPLSTLQFPVDQPDLETLALEVIETVQVSEREMRGRDGRVYALRLHPYRTADKRIDGAVIVLVDVDDRSRAQAQLTLARDQVQAVLDTAWEPLVVLDPDERVVSANRPFYEMFRVTSGATEGRGLFDLAGGRWDIAVLRQRLAEVHAGGAELRGLDVTVDLEEVGRRILLLNARRIVGYGEEPRHILLAFEEVTERRRTETDLRVQRDDLVTAADRKDEFLAMLAHELRNPLGPMSAAVQILRLTSHATPEAQQAWAIMDRQLHHMTRLIDDLLDVSRITSGRIELRRERVDLGATMNIVAGVLRPRFETARHELVVDLPSEPIIVHADPVRLGQIVENFLTNALKYTDPGGRIELSATVEGDQAVLRVRDSGIGIAPEVLPSIWDPFFQAEPSGARARSGLGIGLTLVRRIVDLHGGTVEARSEGPGQGSEFTARLPRIYQPTAPAPEGAPAAEGTPVPEGARWTVLVVEDNLDAATTMQMLLQLLGHKAEVAYTGRAALRLAGAQRFDIVFLDIGLPDMDGYELARRLREETGLTDVPMIALSGHGGEEDRRRSRAAGIDTHVVKPMPPDVLARLLADLKYRPGS
jgi:two-component system CheB/CheR fusion protein